MGDGGGEGVRAAGFFTASSAWIRDIRSLAAFTAPSLPS